MIWYEVVHWSFGTARRGLSGLRPLLAVSNVTAHPSTAGVLLYKYWRWGSTTAELAATRRDVVISADKTRALAAAAVYRCCAPVVVVVVVVDVSPGQLHLQYTHTSFQQPISVAYVSAQSQCQSTLHAQLYCLLLSTFSLLLVVTSHLLLDVFARQLLLSGMVYPSNVRTFRRHLESHLSTQPFPLPSNPSQRLWFVHDYGYLLTYLLTYHIITTNLVLSYTAGCCHLLNLAAWVHYNLQSTLEVP